MNPIRSAPAAAAAAACSGSRKPQIFTTLATGEKPRQSFLAEGLARPLQQRLHCRGSVRRGDETLPNQHGVRPRVKESLRRRSVRILRSPRRLTASSGASGASRSLTLRSTVKVFRSRLLIPTTLAPTAAARSISRSSWTSTSASMPQAAAAARSSAQRRVVQCRDDQQHRIGAMRPRLHDLIWVDDEVFAEDRNGPVAGVGRHSRRLRDRRGCPGKTAHRSAPRSPPRRPRCSHLPPSPGRR